MHNTDPGVNNSDGESHATIINDHQGLTSDPFINSIINSLPFPVLIVNSKRQVLYSNKILSTMLQIDDKSDFLGRRPGDIMGCVNSGNDIGCGSAEQCSVCGIVRVILDCFETSQATKGNATVRAKTQSGEDVLELVVTGIPIHFDGKMFAFVILQDVSANNRRKVLERIFFHDIINYLSAIISALDLIEADPVQNSMLISLLKDTSKMLFHEIQSHRTLVLAEQNELTVLPVKIDFFVLINNATKLVLTDPVSKGKRIEILSDKSISCIIDPSILERVIINLLKNALEETKTGGCIQLDYGIRISEIFISVKNDSVMPKEVSYKIFHKTFSTKGSGRGIGTFSIKLLTERYLGGQVTFESNDLVGTVFTVVFPYKTL